MNDEPSMKVCPNYEEYSDCLTNERPSTISDSDPMSNSSAVASSTVRPGITFVQGIGDSSVHSNQSLPVATEVHEENSVAEFPFIYAKVLKTERHQITSFLKVSLVMIITFLSVILAVTITYVIELQAVSNSLFPYSISDNEQKIKEILIPISGKELLEDPRSAQHYSWKVVSKSFPFTPQNATYELDETNRVIQRYVAFLVGISLSSDFKNFFGSALTDGDLIMPDECQAFTCNDNGEITLLMMKNNKYTITSGGTLSREIGALKSLTHLILSRNNLKGTIPTEIGNLEKLEILDLQKNSMEGSIPSEISGLKSLKWLFLQDNNFNHTIPTSLGIMTNLRYINLSMNSFNGPLPMEINKVEELKGIELYDNDISDSAMLLCDKIYENTFFNYKIYLGKSFWTEFEYSYRGYFGVIIDCIGRNATSNCHCCTCKESETIH